MDHQSSKLLNALANDTGSLLKLQHAPDALLNHAVIITALKPTHPERNEPRQQRAL